MKSIKVLHLANWNSTNIGNGALIHGSEKVFKEDISMDVEFIPEAWDDYTFKRKKFDESFVSLVNDTADVLMVNGAVTFNAFRKKNLHTGMRFDLPLPLWDEIKKPIILYGLSYRCWPFQQYPNLDALKAMITYAIKAPYVFFAVRNDGTKEWIQRMCGIDSDQIHEIPDPGLFVPFGDCNYPELHPTKKNILIAFNGEDAVYRYATKFQKQVWQLLSSFVSDRLLKKIFSSIAGYKKERKKVVKELTKTVEQIAKNYDAQFVLVPHYLDDYEIIQEFISVLQERIAHQLVTSTGLLTVPHTKYFYGRYKKADLVLAMRVHSMSPSIGLNTPVVPITSQGRMRSFLEKINLLDISVDTSKECFHTDLYAKCKDILDDPKTIQMKLAESTRSMRENFLTINKNIEKFLVERL